MAGNSEENDDALTITMTPVQLAALFTGQDISHEASLSNRLWGTAALVGSIFELAGAGLMCLAPDPTLITKVGCVIVGAHGLDSLVTSGRKVRTGRDHSTLTAQTVREMALEIGASPNAAEAISIGVDVAVPLAVTEGLGAARVIAVSRGERIVLAEHEALVGTRLGGHTVFKHVGWTNVQILDRLAKTEKMGSRAPKMISTFSDLGTAELAISQALKANSGVIRAWARTAGSGAVQSFNWDVGRVIGHGIARGSTIPINLSNIKIVLKMESYNGKPFYILTSHPI